MKKGEFAIFTFGREHEVACAIQHVGDELKAQPLVKVINLIHDFLEGEPNESELIDAIYCSFSEGGTGVWESTGSWVLKLAKHDSKYNEVWERLAKHSLAAVRIRVASFIDTMPEEAAGLAYKRLESDKSKRVVEMVSDRWRFRNCEYQEGKST